MLTCTDEYYKGRFSFRVFARDPGPTQVFEFLDAELEDQALARKLKSILNAIDSDPLGYYHPQKFKRLEGDVWEIKIKQYRIACLWDTKPENLIAIYGYIKKRNNWPKHEMERMWNQRDKYLSIRKACLKGERDGRTRKIQR